jgi:hypothetical protein
MALELDHFSTVIGSVPVPLTDRKDVHAFADSETSPSTRGPGRFRLPEREPEGPAVSPV